MNKRWILVSAAMFLIVGLVYLQPAFQLVSAQEQSTFSDDFSRDSSSWQLLGSAYRNQTGQCLVLTPTGNQQAGVAIFNAPIKGSFTASFRYKAGGGYHGDGFTLFFYKQEYGSAIDYSYSGSREGFNTESIIPGYGIEFDGWQNIPWDFQSTTGGQQNPQGDPTGSHIAVIKDFTGNHLTYVNDTRVSDNNWHWVTVHVEGSSVSVTVDQMMVLQWSGTFDRTYGGFGFSGATGGVGSDWHIIDDFSITAKNLHTPTLTTTCVSSMTTASFPVKINGLLTYSGAGISDAPILLSYSVTGGESWQDLTLVHTNTEGSYSALWLLSVTGDYMLKALYKGDDDYLGTSNTVSFSVAPCTTQSTFSVTSNSTLSKLSFSSSNKELSFSVSGEDGSTGYVNVFVPNALVSDVSGLEIYLDGNRIDYTVQPLSDGWLLYVAYHHSAHLVLISLGSSPLNPTDNPLSTQSTQATSPSEASEATIDWVKIAILGFMGIVATITAAFATLYLKRKNAK